MGSMTFIRASDQKSLSFDSSPQYSLPKAFGWAEGSVIVEEQRRDEKTIVFAVSAKPSNDSPAAIHMGTLFQKTREAIWKSQDRFS